MEFIRLNKKQEGQKRLLTMNMKKNLKDLKCKKVITA